MAPLHSIRSLACFTLGNEQDLCHENIDLVNTYLFYQVCKVHDIVCLGDQSANTRRPHGLSFETFLPKTGVLDGNCIITKFLSKLCQIFDKNLIETPVLGRNVSS